MKLTYRGVSYEYNAPQVEFSNAATVGKYRGLDVKFRNPQKAFVQQPTLDLRYRGVAHNTNPVAAIKVEDLLAPIVVTASEASNLPVLSTQDKARSLMMSHHRMIKQRQQAMLTRLSTEVGLTASDAHYWNPIQGKVHPSFRATYDRSHAALS